MKEIRISDVLTFIEPDSQWVITGNEYEGIQWLNDITVTKERLETEIKVYQKHIEKMENDKAAAKASAQAKLAALGLTADEIKAISNA